jgi:hypothetical protein
MYHGINLSTNWLAFRSVGCCILPFSSYRAVLPVTRCDILYLLSGNIPYPSTCSWGWNLDDWSIHVYNRLSTGSPYCFCSSRLEVLPFVCVYNGGNDRNYMVVFSGGKN